MMKKIILICLLFITSVSCNRKADSTSSNESYTNEITTESVILESATKENVSLENLQYDFKLENIVETKGDLDFKSLGIPEKFVKSNFLEYTSGTGDDIDVLIGTVVQKVRTENGNSYFKNLVINHKKANVNLKLKFPTDDPIIYEETFDYNTSQNLSALIGGITNNKKIAYLFQIIELSNIYVNDKEIDIKSLNAYVDGRSDEVLKELYIIMGATHYSLKATAFEESSLKGNFNYAIKIDGNKYAKTQKVSKNKKIAITAVPISELLFVKNY